jgi:hypothetical protein
MKTAILVILIASNFAMAQNSFKFVCEDKELYWTDIFPQAHFLLRGELLQKSSHEFVIKSFSLKIDAKRITGESLHENVGGKNIPNNPRYKPRSYVRYAQFDITNANFKNIFGAVKLLIPQNAGPKFDVAIQMAGIEDHDGNTAGLECVKLQSLKAPHQ